MKNSKNHCELFTLINWKWKKEDDIYHNWEAYEDRDMDNAPYVHGKMGVGSTPEEAVANLWLALNK